MARHTLEYGEGLLRFELPDWLPLERLELGEVRPHKPAGEIVREALAASFGQQLKAKIRPESRICLISDDISRPTPVALILQELLPFFADLGVTDEQVQIALALGTHRPMTDAELARKIGAFGERFSVCQPLYNRRQDFAPALVTKQGETIELYHKVLESDVRVGIGNIVPHNTLGWSGGGKILFPGVASEASIANFHLKAALSPVSLFGLIENAVRDEVEGWVQEIGLDFIVNTVLNRDDEVIACFAGDFVQAHRAGVRAAEEIYGRPFQEKADLVIVNGEPSSFDFWQGTKGLNAADIVAADGADVILCIPCGEGVGPHPEYLDFLGRDDADRVLKAYLDSPNPAYDPLAVAVGTMIAKMRARFRIHLYSDGISEGECRRAGIQKSNDLQETLTDILSRRQVQRAALIRQGAEILPLLYERKERPC